MNKEIFDTLLKDYKKDENRHNKILVGFLKLDNGRYATVSIRKFEEYHKPHMHIDADNVHVAVRLDKPKYYIHKGYPDKLHDNEISRLVEVLNDKYSDTNLSNWQFASTEYNRGFESTRSYDIPEYNMLNA